MPEIDKEFLNVCNARAKNERNKFMRMTNAIWVKGESRLTPKDFHSHSQCFVEKLKRVEHI